MVNNTKDMPLDFGVNCTHEPNLIPSPTNIIHLANLVHLRQRDSSFTRNFRSLILIQNESSLHTCGRNMMRISYWRNNLILRHPFGISRGSRSAVPVIIVKLERDGLAGYGEASPNSRYGETPESVEAFLRKVDLGQLDEPWHPRQLSEYLDSVSEHDQSAKAALDIAVHDWIAKKHELPLYGYLGLQKPGAITTSFTIGIDTPQNISQKIIEAANYPMYKIKVGIKDDVDIIRAVRSSTSKPLRVDANEGWKTKEEAFEKIKWLSGQNVELVEQPLPASQIKDVRWLRERVNIPLIADEGLQSIEDLKTIASAYDGINVKIQKVGGLYNSKKIIESAKRQGLKVMIGCMIESSVGITAAAHLASLVDWVDLDGNVLITNDPFVGAEDRDGRIILNDLPGLGVAPVR